MTTSELFTQVGPFYLATSGPLLHVHSQAGLEKGTRICLDATGVESNIHYPTDALLLQDGIGLITRYLMVGKTLTPRPAYTFGDHRRVVKKRVTKIRDAKKKQVRERAYRDLLRLAEQVRRYVLGAMATLKGFEADDWFQVVKARRLAEELERAVLVLGRVQTARRMLRGEKVPASEKVISVLECHADIIEKGDRGPLFGQKVFLTGGVSGMILDCLVVRGNPADASLFPRLIERQEQLFWRVPRQTAADGGFASGENLRWAKARGVRDVMFAKRRGLSILEMIKSLWVYKKLRNFRLSGLRKRYW